MAPNNPTLPIMAPNSIKLSFLRINIVVHLLY